MSGTTAARATAKPAISAHPAFPAIVALWFAALLGIGSLVLPVALFERLSGDIGLPGYLAAAQPPLGVTARICVAAFAALTGVVVGYLLARRIARAQKARRVPARAGRSDADFVPTAPAKRPISAHDELGEGGIDDDAPPARAAFMGRRRPLSVTDDSARSEFFDDAPVPGHSEQATPMATPTETPDHEAAPVATEEPLDLGPFDAAEEPAPDAGLHFDAFARGTDASTPPVRFETAKFEPFGTAAMSGPPRARATYEPARVRREETRMTDGPVTQSGPAGDSPQAPATGSPAQAPRDITLVDLVDRFARALHQHREDARAEAAAADASAVEEVIDLTAALASRGTPLDEPATPVEQPEITPSTPTFTAPHVPAALRPLEFGSDEAGDEVEEAVPALDLSQAIAQSARPFARPTETATVPDTTAFDEVSEDQDDDDDDDESYPSLLAMKSPFGLPREPVRIEDEEDTHGDTGEEDRVIEPVVVFPGQAARPAAVPRPFDAPAKRAEAAGHATAAGTARAPLAGGTEDALREALEKLQRMSGTA